MTYVISLVDGHVGFDGEPTGVTTPDGPNSLDLVTVLHRAAHYFHDHGEGVLLVDQAAAEQLGLWRPGPAPEPGDDALRDWAGFVPARDNGWNVTGLAPWMSFHAGMTSVPGKGLRPTRPRVRVCVLPWLDHDAVAGMADDGPAAFARNLARYHELTRSAFHTHPGVAGLALLRDVAAPLLKTEPYWKPPVEQWPEDVRACEYDLIWERDHDKPARYTHAYDARRAYLAAAQNANLALGNLTYQQRGAIDWSPHWAGYWRIPVPAWNVPWMPHPAGPAAMAVPAGELIWVSTPTMTLLDELGNDGWVSTPKPVESLVALGRPQDRYGPTARVFREWANTLNTAALDTAGVDEDQAVNAAIKIVYSAAIGQLNTPTGRIYRPDWRHTIIALTRANLWRKMWRIGAATGRWPVSVYRDSLRYLSDEPDPVAACPYGLILGDRLGQFKHEQTWDTKAAAVNGQ